MLDGLSYLVGLSCRQRTGDWGLPAALPPADAAAARRALFVPVAALWRKPGSLPLLPRMGACLCVQDSPNTAVASAWATEAARTHTPGRRRQAPP